MTQGTRCGYANCDTVIPFKVEWRPFGDGSQGTWTSVTDYRAMNAHIANDHRPSPARTVVRR